MDNNMANTNTNIREQIIKEFWMRKICIIPALLAVILALAACDLIDDISDKINKPGTPVNPVDPPSTPSYPGVDRYVAKPYTGTARATAYTTGDRAATAAVLDNIKYSYKCMGYDVYYIYLGVFENVPLFYDDMHRHSGATSTSTYTFSTTSATTDTIANTIAESSQRTDSTAQEHTVTETNGVNTGVEVSVGWGFLVEAEVKAHLDYEWSKAVADSSSYGIQLTTSLTNTTEYATSKSTSFMRERNFTFTKDDKYGYYRYTCFSFSDVYLWVVRDSKGQIYYEFREYVRPRDQFFWDLDYSETPDFDKTNDTKFKFDVSILDNLPPSAVDLDHVQKITLNREAIGLERGKTFSLFARIEPEYATNKDVTWKSLNPDIATVSDTGVVTGVSFGTGTATAIITATPVDPTYKGAPAKCTVEVSKEIYPVTGISLTPSTLILKVVGTGYLDVNLTPSNATEPHIKFESSNEAIATVDEYGTVTAIKVGTIRITAAPVDTAYKGTIPYCDVTVVQSPTGITLNKSSIKLNVGETENLTVTVTPSNAYDKGVNWTSSNEDFATVDENGKVTAKSKGKARITASPKDDTLSPPSVWCDVEVWDPVTGISLNKNSITLKGTETLIATITPITASDTKVDWASDNPSVATVDNNGVVTAKSPGTAKITVTAQDTIKGTKSATCTVNVPILVTVYQNSRNDGHRIGDEADKATGAEWCYFDHHDAGLDVERLRKEGYNWVNFKLDFQIQHYTTGYVGICIYGGSGEIRAPFEGSVSGNWVTTGKSIEFDIGSGKKYYNYSWNPGRMSLSSFTSDFTVRWWAWGDGWDIYDLKERTITVTATK